MKMAHAELLDTEGLLLFFFFLQYYYNILLQPWKQCHKYLKGGLKDPICAD